MLRRPWTIETDAEKADFIIETERWRCAAGRGFHLIDEITRLDRSFAWTYSRRAQPDVTNVSYYGPTVANAALIGIKPEQTGRAK